MQNQEQFQQQIQNEEEYQYPQEQDYDMPYQIERSISADASYNVYPRSDLFRKIYQEIQLKCNITYLPLSWNLMLYYLCQFSTDYLLLVTDAEGTGRKMVHYTPDYQIIQQFGECQVCCMQGILYNNSCGHYYCDNCWIGLLNLSHNNRRQYELFPRCQHEGCYHLTNYILMQELFQKNLKMRTSFQQLLSIQYAQKSQNVRLCTKQGCNNVILINYGFDKLECKCGTKICRTCRSEEHVLIQCQDLKAWNYMVNNRQDQWLNMIVTQKCPMCKYIIQKNQGCIHMTCICKYQFCWICLKVWKGHTNYGQCSSVKKQQFQKQLQKQKEKRKQNIQFFSQRFEQSKQQINRLQKIINRIKKLNIQTLQQYLDTLKIMRIDASKLFQLKQCVQIFLQFSKNACIYRFFQRNKHESIHNKIKQMSKDIDKIDQFLFNFLPKIVTQKPKKQQNFQQLYQKQKSQNYEKMKYMKKQIQNIYKQVNS